MRTALGSEFLAAYLHGSVLTQGFDEATKHKVLAGNAAAVYGLT